MPRSILRLALVAGIGCLIAFTQVASVALADDEPGELYTATKKEFVEKFEKFKREGLTAAQIQKLTHQLLEAVGDRIDGTGTEFLLKTMNKQAENTVWIMKQKKTVEELIDFVGDVYAMASSDTPPDPEEAYKLLSKGVGLAAKLADEIPVLKLVAVPMLEASAQAIKNGEDDIAVIAAAAKARDEAVELGWRSPDYSYALLAATEMDEAEDDEPTEEDLQWEADRILRQADYGDRLSACGVEYSVYDKASVARRRARKRVGNQQELLDKDKRSANTRRVRYNALVPHYKGSHTGFRNALKYRDNLRAEMQLAESRGNGQAYLTLKEMLENFEKELVSLKENLRKEYKETSQMRSEYLEARIKAAQTRSEYNSLLEAYKKIDSDVKKAKAAFDSCMELSDASESTKEVIEIKYLSDVNELSWGNLWRPLEKTTSTLGGRKYKKSLRTVPKKGGISGFVEVKLGGMFSEFHAIAGMLEPYPIHSIDPICATSRRMGYKVIVDDVIKAEGISLYDYRTINVNIKDAQKLRLEVNDGGDEHWCDWFVWADAYVVCNGPCEAD